MTELDFSLLLTDIADDYLLDVEAFLAKKRGKKPISGGKKVFFALIAAVLCLLGGLVTAMAVKEDLRETILGWIVRASVEEVDAPSEETTEKTQRVELEPVQVNEQLENGEWVYLEGDTIAVILPTTPVKIMLSEDHGTTWQESTITGSEQMEAFETLIPDMQYLGGYIGMFSDTGGYLLLTGSIAMGRQPLRIYLSDDALASWHEIDPPTYRGVVTGAGFASQTVGFISYRYYEDEGPEIWCTYNGGRTWEKLTVQIPTDYQNDAYRFTPGSPTFENGSGVYPIEVLDQDTGERLTIEMYSEDGGLTWQFK